MVAVHGRCTAAGQLIVNVNGIKLCIVRTICGQYSISKSRHSNVQ